MSRVDSNKLFLSVLMPVYNAGNYLNAAIKSILDQTYSNFELLIVDDFSSDHSWKLISSFNDSRIHTFRNTANLGYLKSCNFLFENSKGDLITFQDADDYSDLDRLKKQVQCFIKNPNLGICGTSIHIINKNGKLIRCQSKPEHHQEIKRNISNHSQFCGASIMVTRKVLDSIGGYRSYFDRIGSEDYDWSMRIVERFEAMNHPDYLYYYRQHPASISKEINPRKVISAKMAKLFSEQRRLYSFDALQKGELEAIEVAENIFLEIYNRDRSLIYIESAAGYNYFEMYIQAIKASFMAIRINPFSSRNFRTLLYCLKIFIQSKLPL